MINGKIVLAVTLARGGSKSIPKKNMADIHGRPLLSYTIDEVRKSKYIDSYLVSTDDPVIINYCKNNMIKYIKRPDDLATDTAKSSDALIHAIRLEHCDYVIEAMATNPLKTHEDIDGAIEMLHNSNAESVVSVRRIYDEHPSRVKYLDEKGMMVDFYPEIPESRRQDLSPPAYIRNGSIYAMKKSFLINNGVRYDKKSLAYIMPNERTINIDEPEDLEFAKIKIKT